MTFWSVHDEGAIVGCGAIKALDAVHAEVKSMRTAVARKRGAGSPSPVLGHHHRRVGPHGVHPAEPGDGPGRPLRPRQVLYAKFGFTYCEPFAGYRPDPLSVFMTRTLGARTLGLAREPMRAVLLSASLLLLIASPYLPGGYDPLALPLSTLAQIFGGVGLLAVLTSAPLLVWPRNRFWRIAQTTALTITALAVSAAAAAEFGLLLGLASLALWVAVLARRPSPVYFVVLPLVALAGQAALTRPLTAYARDTAVANAAEMIAAVEKSHDDHGVYPDALNAVWPDYRPGVRGVAQYRYAKGGDSYNLAFELPRFFFDAFGTREFVVYNPADRHLMPSHASWCCCGPTPGSATSRAGTDPTTPDHRTGGHSFSTSDSSCRSGRLGERGRRRRRLLTPPHPPPERQRDHEEHGHHGQPRQQRADDHRQRLGEVLQAVPARLQAGQEAGLLFLRLDRGADGPTRVIVTVAMPVRSASDFCRAWRASRSEVRAWISRSMSMISPIFSALVSRVRNCATAASADFTRASTSATSPVTSSVPWCSDSVTPSSLPRRPIVPGYWAGGILKVIVDFWREPEGVGALLRDVAAGPR